MAGDFTGDGRTDLAVARHYNPVTLPRGAVSVLLGNGDGTFQPAVQYATALSTPSAIVAGDFTGDGRLDLAVACYNYDTNEAESRCSWATATGTFQPPRHLRVRRGAAPQHRGGGFHWRRPELTWPSPFTLFCRGGIGQGGVSVLLSNGDGTFQPQVTYAVGDGPVSIVTGDFTGDGRTDLAVVDGNGIDLLIGKGDGTFEPFKTVASGAYSSGGR